jgi:hypothetical protein
VADRIDGLARWHAFVASRDLDVLDDALDADAVFESPVVHTPQLGRAITRMYLAGAAMTLGNETFRYVGEWRAENTAVLEFACEVDGITVNGVDMIWWNDEGRITRFKVMVRPLKAMEMLRAKMAALLARMSATGS